ncbi:gas vesicle protein GvpN [Desulfomonile tiedjei]|uniref:Gas vesicle protein GvpN n=1 Tax=Desulfomonile tiedjei (strain ATCC 49306 / DSM 6799 / DCB-1) TaxID=706587 RepID=I4CDB9_DESTA|nr:gas vesicle protein GvpN [Desulfomonile tiedjei]AFM27560.1 gas vesicle protein GvpN [Desulfomonile tiedjei DSM 6799]
MNGAELRIASIETEVITANNENIVPEAGDRFVNTPHVEELTARAMAYLEVGYSVHFSGVAGTGKTTLAFHAAAKLGRPVILVHGDHEFGSSDLIGRDAGYKKSRLVDNFIHSVVKTEEEMRSLWVDNRLTTACRDGYTLIYDEFTRSRPEANNVLLSILEEKILNLPSLRRTGEGYLEVHPSFRAIFTSNPEEYAGVHKTQDALMDRIITINVDHYDRETEIEITRAKSGVCKQDATVIVDIIRELRLLGVNNHRPTIRAAIAIARVLAHTGEHADQHNSVFQWLCKDVLSTDTVKVSRGGSPLMAKKVEEVIRKVCGRTGGKRSGKPVGSKEETSE